LNMPLLAFVWAGERGGAACAEFSLVHTDCSHVMIETIKQSEDGQAVTVRLYEYRNQSENRVGLHFAYPVRSVAETNLCEEGQTPVAVEDNQIYFAVGAFEIKTFQVYFERNSV
ncbi:MAG: alpha-mannosidase, partial [Lachnospiraceae bacterium]|nr:alpha-mannosidase [Lachnospiraceae bacterium]